ncbi:indolepyruvate ferredoxin oxidoreductase alpha subunit [Marinitoga hydrogenitolerans DSM 16785]|uniref:Indolepyruvate oxidoreductase subunit IorA n=1 Tax=Marinitoga hydrogenitolerans (strain DSM 16785 / JCM 12826 / AT1271) TaxID=1122195 RepID=A0A1M4WBU3_MARH1|nr:thiamine pyrophosphate-dependent enzyme [Marinitoga hydrogenitolerans]SHE78432.1 indolepyruvate ferredoxin oxidoreductase alpha subunit [Marinitoga hydrogenitolerans DSM 16785]
MKTLGEILISERPISEIVMGNHALVRAMLESGVRVVTSYPGSPTPEIAEGIRNIPKEKNPMYFEFSVNEKVATEVAFGASMNGHLSTVFFKSVGLNVAADSFVQLGLFDLIGGMVIVLGDDPGANSSQNEQDNRHFSKLSYIPIFEPNSPREIYEMFKEAAKLSKELHMPVILRLTTHVCHAKQKIDFGELIIEKYDYSPKFDHINAPHIPIAARALEMKKRALEKLEKFKEISNNSKFNEYINNNNYKRGIIVSGLPYLSLLDVLEYTDQKIDILKIGITNPLPEKKIIEFLKTHEEVKILEELDDIMEKDIKALAFDNNINCKIIGKIDIEDWIGEYKPDKVYGILKKTWPDLLPNLDIKIPEIQLSPRPPQLCPGCGHRSAFHAIKYALKDTDITVADIGCHTLGYLEPYNMGQVLLSMGHSTSTASGLSLFNKTRNVVAFLGDSTLFHAGIPGIINAIFNNHNLTLIIMENGTTAMTGHQDLPSIGKNINGPTEAVPIRKMLEELGVKFIREVDTYQQSKLREYVLEAQKEKGLKVIIAKHPCMLKLTREQRKKGIYKNNKVEVTEKCDHQYVCISDFGCPAYQITPEGNVWVQEDLCIGDGSCVQTCPTNALSFKIVSKGGNR